MSLEPTYISNWDEGGLNTRYKPFLLIDKAFQQLFDAYVWRGQVKKREGIEIVGRLSRLGVNISLSNTLNSSTYTNGGTTLLSSLMVNTINPLVKPYEPNAEIAPGTFVLTIDNGGGNKTVVVDTAQNGTLTPSVPNNLSATGGWINYLTGSFSVSFTAPIPGGLSVIVSVNYFPSLPVMGILEYDTSNLEEPITIFFDTIYAYEYISGFQQLGTKTWTGSNSNFFWAANYRGITDDLRYFFVTNFNQAGGDPLRYYDGSAWNDFAPLTSTGFTLFQALLIVPYYGRLIMLNTWEGSTGGGIAASANFFNRCRFSQIGNPIDADGWKTDIFGRGGFIDAPTSEAIVGCAFFKNVLTVFFEASTWQLRYVGEYGLPFIWERINSELGSESTFSPVLFDGGVLAVGDKGIISASATSVSRIDEAIPDFVFDTISNNNQGIIRVQGVRDFQKELVYWCYSDVNYESIFPNRVLVFNYTNQTYAIFRDNVTALGTFRASNGITWDSLTTFWDDYEVLWDSTIGQPFFPFVVSGNQEGFIHKYGYTTQSEWSLSITGINRGVSPIQLTVINHNLETADIIYLQNVFFVDTSTNMVITDPNPLNGFTYMVTVLDANTISLSKWDTVLQQYTTNFVYGPSSLGTYLGGGQVTLFPNIYIQTKDFNPYSQNGGQFKISYVDFMTDATVSASLAVQVFVNSSPSVVGNLLVGNKTVETYATKFYVPNSAYMWHRFFALCSGNYLNLLLTYNDDQMNNIATHQQTLVLNAIAIYGKPGGRTIF